MKLAAVREHVGRYLNRTLARGDADFEDAVGVLSGHPTWRDRLADVIGLRVRRSRLNQSLQLQLKTNRVWFTVSWTACAERARRSTSLSPELKRLHAAMRHAIRPQILRWRRAQPRPWACAGCGSLDKIQVDHATPPFERIRSAFLDGAAPPTQFALSSRSSGIPTFRPQDRGFKKKWTEYHAEQATYQLLCGACNRSKSNHWQIGDRRR